MTTPTNPTVLLVDDEALFVKAACKLLERAGFSAVGCHSLADARALLAGLEDEYDRLYYAGIICERWAMAHLARDNPGCGPIAYDWLRQAMGWYEKAEQIRPASHDDAILRWNTCARMIRKYEHVRPHHDDDFLPLLE